MLEGAEQLEPLLRAHRLALGVADGWFVRAAHAAASAHDGGALRDVAGDELASRPAEVQRRAALAFGHALLRAASALATGPEQKIVAWVQETLAANAPRATSFGSVAYALGAAAEEAAEAHAYTVLAGMVAAAVRLRLIGTLEGQAVLRRVLTSRPIAPDEDWASCSPLLDVAAMRHELLEPRLFAS